jgi:hypothetical protein
MPNIRGDPYDAEYLIALGQVGTRTQLDKPSYIYALWDPDTFLIHYIGRSANVKDRLQKHIDNARSDNYRYRSAPSEWIRSLLEHDERPAAHILETIYPCSALYARDTVNWLMRSLETGGGANEQAVYAYDIYVSERELRHILHAAARGQPLANILGDETACERLAGLDTTGIDFFTVEHEHPIWGMIRGRTGETSPSPAESSAEAMQKNIEDLMRNARTRRVAPSNAP